MATGDEVLEALFLSIYAEGNHRLKIHIYKGNPPMLEVKKTKQNTHTKIIKVARLKKRSLGRSLLFYLLKTYIMNT